MTPAALMKKLLAPGGIGSACQGLSEQVQVRVRVHTCTCVRKAILPSLTSCESQVQVLLGYNV